MSSVPLLPVPVFPLPNVVLFPFGVLPLHVFEVRYRTMVRDVLSSHRRIAMALLEPGWDRDYRGTPPFHPLGCVARIERVEWLVNDCYDLVVVGEARARLDRVVKTYPYRTVRPEPAPQLPFTHDDPLVQIERRALLEVLSLRGVSLSSLHGCLVTESEPPELEALVNRVAMSLEMPPVEKLALLAMDDIVQRANRVRQLLAGARQPEPLPPAAEGPPGPEGGGRN